MNASEYANKIKDYLEGEVQYKQKNPFEQMTDKFLLIGGDLYQLILDIVLIMLMLFLVVTIAQARRKPSSETKERLIFISVALGIAMVATTILMFIVRLGRSVF